jgi:transcriptional regulator with XRE-family HTH domain
MDRSADTGPPPLDHAAIGRRIKQRRLSLDLQQGEVVERLQRDGMLRRKRGDIERDTFSVSHLSRLERGRAGDLKMEDIRALARALDTHVDWLLDGNDPNLSRALESFGPVDSMARAVTSVAALYQAADEKQRQFVENVFVQVAEFLRQHSGDTEPPEATIIVAEEPKNNGVMVPSIH